MAASKAPTDRIRGALHGRTSGCSARNTWLDSKTGLKRPPDDGSSGPPDLGQIRRPGEEDRLNTSKAITLRGETAATSGARIRLVIRGLRVITPAGRLIEVAAQQEADLRIPLTKSPGKPRSVWTIYLLPQGVPDTATPMERYPSAFSVSCRGGAP